MSTAIKHHRLVPRHFISEAGQIVSTAGIAKEGHVSVNLEPTDPWKSFVKARETQTHSRKARLTKERIKDYQNLLTPSKGRYFWFGK